MSSVLDAVIASEMSGVGLSAVPSSDVRRQRSEPQPSSRPDGLPSESQGHHSDESGFPDDEIVGLHGNLKTRPRNPLDRAVPRVVDVTGETVQQNFEEFLEQ